MTFNSVQYVAYLAGFVAIYWSIPRRYQNHALLAASYAFYAFWDVRFLPLLAIASLVDFFVGKRMEATDDPRRRKQLLAISLVWNLGALGFFKYANFFLDSTVDLLHSLGLSVSRPSLQIVLPVAISFFTFQSIAYTVTIYRGRMRAATNLVDFAVYVAFFPQLVAGPIERPWHILPQFQRARSFPDADRITRGVLLIFTGLVKKVVVADTAAEVARQTFSDPSRTSSVALVLGVYAFAVQIYFDFSAYTDIARGSARLLGIELIENFREPYLSRDPTEFWRRWHISLSEWMRDYVFIPLGGSRASELVTARNLFVTMLLGGLWHGADWTFVAWGAYWGIVLVIARYVWPRRDPDRPVRVADVGRILLTFHLACLGWVLFRADSLGQAVDIVGRIVALQGGNTPVEVVQTPILLAATLAFDLFRRRTRLGGLQPLASPRTAGVAVAAGALALVVFSGAAPVQFVYFQF